MTTWGAWFLVLAGFLAFPRLPAAADAPAPTGSEPVNHPPYLAEPIGHPKVKEGEPLFIMIHAVDPDTDSLEFIVSALPGGARFEDLGRGWATFEWIPRFDQSGTYEVTIRASERHVSITPLFTEERVSITVEEAGLAISGKILEPYSSLGIAGVTMSLSVSQVGSLERPIQETTTDAKGYYLLKDLKPVAYKVRPFLVVPVKGGSEVKPATKTLKFSPAVREVTVTDRDVFQVDFERAIQ